MRQLTPEEVEALANRAKVRKIAVENVIGWIDPSQPLSAHLYSVQSDARLYKWNAPTQKAMRDGLMKAYGRK